MIHGLAHVCFTVRHLDASLTFYSETLGLKKAFDFVNDKGVRFGVYLKVGGRNFIELFEAAPGQPVPPAGQSYQHLCLEVQDIQQTVGELAARGVAASPPKLGTDQSWQAWITDPDGNRIELHQYTATSWQKPWLG
jgi:glyoxylase I family protein